MNLSRVIAWVHWPYDILAWACVWVWSAYIIYKYQASKYLKMLDSFALKIASFLKL
jgi:membrane-associated phospholipid phosphatase